MARYFPKSFPEISEDKASPVKFLQRRVENTDEEGKEEEMFFESKLIALRQDAICVLSYNISQRGGPQGKASERDEESASNSPEKDGFQ